MHWSVDQEHPKCGGDPTGSQIWAWAGETDRRRAAKTIAPNDRRAARWRSIAA
jgi:hypothetical protein